MKLIFICAPYSMLDENYYKSMNYSRYVINKGYIPINTVTMYHGVLDERIPEDYKTVTDANKELIKHCDEVWVFGNGAETLIADAVAIGKPVKYIEDTFTIKTCSESLSVIMRTYQDKTGQPVNRAIMDNVLFYLNKGLSDRLIVEAISKGALTTSNWKYIEGILRNCLRRGITTAEEFLNDKPQKNDTMAAYDIDLFEEMLRNKE